MFRLTIALLYLFQLGNSVENGHKLYKLTTTRRENLDFLHILEADPDFQFSSPVNRVGKPIYLTVGPHEQQDFETLLRLKRMQFEIVDDNVERTFQKYLETSPRGRLQPGQISFTQYNSHEEMNAYLDRLASSYPNFVSVHSIGKSYEGRDMKLVRISSGVKKTDKPVIFIDAGIHAREWTAPATALYIINQLVENDANRKLSEDIEWIIIPSLNPDGYTYSMTNETNNSWRKTRSHGKKCIGVDPNRNFGYKWSADANECSLVYPGTKPFSENETKNLRDYLNTLTNVKAYMTLHSCGKFLLYPWGYAEIPADNAEELKQIGNAMKEAIAATSEIGSHDYRVGNSAIDLYPAAGGSDDWAMSIGINISFTIELPCGDLIGGFAVAPEQISAVGKETFAGFKALHGYVRKL